jgi:hypothetical protein
MKKKLRMSRRTKTTKTTKTSVKIRLTASRYLILQNGFQTKFCSQELSGPDSIVDSIP